jgi:hypothetical protein
MKPNKNRVESARGPIAQAFKIGHSSKTLIKNRITVPNKKPCVSQTVTAICEAAMICELAGILR